MMLLSSSCKTLLQQRNYSVLRGCVFASTQFRSFAHHTTFDTNTTLAQMPSSQSLIVNNNKKNFFVPSPSSVSSIDLNEEVQSLNQALASLLIDGEESSRNNETLEMDSVKRKRHKKIKRHKYRKRLKDTRAERKRLGKR